MPAKKAGVKKETKKDVEKVEYVASPKETSSSGENLVVAVRVRPLKSEEAEKGSYNIVSVLGEDKIELREAETAKDDHLRKNRFKDKVFSYDKAFGPDCTQDEVYSGTARPLVEDVLKGFNATVFAYGATGAGKTFTMVRGERNVGIMVKALNDIFTAMSNNRNNNLKFDISMSYLEIYNENIRDLLHPSSGTLELREDQKTGVIQVAGLSKTSTTSTTEVLDLLTKGNKVRICESTAANKTSSRSHALLQVTVKQTLQGGEKAKVKVGTLYMIDLAGSERAKETQNSGKRLQEGAYINRSLLALGNCINALGEGKAKYVNYRDSKLTRLLKDALSGNCRTVMIAHVSPSHKQREETRKTLIYADTAKNITKKTRRNVLDVSYHISQYQAIITELRGEITRLNSKLTVGPASGGGDGDDDFAHNSVKTRQLKKELIEMFRTQMDLRTKLVEIDNNVMALSMEFERQNQVVQEWEAERLRRSKKLYPSSKTNNEITIDMDKDREYDSTEEEDEPEEVSQAWEDLVFLQKEQQRYTDMREKIEQEMNECKKKGHELEEELPSAINSEDQKELLTLLCKVHELEIQKMEMESEAVLKEHELQRRDLLILRYDRQRSLCEEIITRQRQMLEGKNAADIQHSMPPELQDLYSMYQQELQYTNVDRDARYLNELNTIYRSPSVTSLRNHSSDHLPPIQPHSGSSNQERLFRARRHSIGSVQRSVSPTLSLRSNASSVSSYHPPSLPGSSPISRYPTLPPIKSSSAAPLFIAHQTPATQEMREAAAHVNALAARIMNARPAADDRPEGRVYGTPPRHSRSLSDDGIVTIVLPEEPPRTSRPPKRKTGPSSAPEKYPMQKAPVLVTKKTPRQKSLPRLQQTPGGVAAIAGRGHKKPLPSTKPNSNTSTNSYKNNNNNNINKSRSTNVSSSNSVKHNNNNNKTANTRRRSRSHDAFNMVGLTRQY